MGWLRRDKTETIGADYLANLLNNEFILTQDQRFQPQYYGVPEKFHGPFVTKMKLYREALILMVILGRVQNDEANKPLLTEYERIILPGDAPTPEGFEKMHAIKEAMKDLRDLFHSVAKPNGLPWCTNWFLEAGITQTAPLMDILLNTVWMNEWLAAQKSLDQIQGRTAIVAVR
jgi:hypothetical protein